MYYVPTTLIDPNPWQPRQAMDPAKIQELAASIKSYAEARPGTKGLLQIPAGRLVYPDPQLKTLEITVALARGARVQLAFGHRRNAAFGVLDYPDLPVDLADYTDEEMATMAWTENDHDDLTPIDRAKYIQRYLADFKLTQEQAAQKLNMSRSALANLLRLLKLPEELQAALASGQISARQADALLALYAVPAALLERGEKEWDQNVKPSAIVRDCLAGESSDNTRERTRRLIERFSEKLNTAGWRLDRVFDEHVDFYAPSCAACDSRLDAGNWKYCLRPACFRGRTKAYQRQYLENAGKAAGIPVLEDGIDPYNVHDFSGWRNESEDLKKILEIQPLCTNLRLAWSDRDGKPHVDGKPHAAVVCCKRRQYCTCQNGLNAAKEMARKALVQPPADNGAHPETAPEGKPLSQVFEEQDLAAIAKQARQEKKARQSQVKALRAAAAGVIAKGIAENQPGAWWMILDRCQWGQAGLPADAGIADIQAALAARIVEHEVMGYAEDDDPELALSRCNQHLKKAGLPLLSPDGSLSQTPTTDDPAAKLANRWERVKGWIDGLPKSAPTSAAVRGNLDNLAAIDEELAVMLEENPALADDPFIAPILSEGEENGITAHLERLSALYEVLERDDWPLVTDKQFESVSWLYHTPASDGNFKSHLESATAPVLAYALALLSGLPNHGTRAAAIRSRLNRLEKEGAKP